MKGKLLDVIALKDTTFNIYVQSTIKIVRNYINQIQYFVLNPNIVKYILREALRHSICQTFPKLYSSPPPPHTHKKKGFMNLTPPSTRMNKLK
jgi:hypothetical protein